MVMAVPEPSEEDGDVAVEEFFLVDVVSDFSDPDSLLVLQEEKDKMDIAIRSIIVFSIQP
jgi:hypothetical protein